MDTIREDFRYAFRTLRRSPVLVITALLSLGLGIGANAAVVSFVNAIQFRPLPFDDQDALIDIEETSATELCAGCAVGTSWPTFQDWRRRATSFDALGGCTERRFVLSGMDSEPERVIGAFVTPGLFRLLGVGPVAGRELTAADDRPGSTPVVVLSGRLWKRFAASRDVLSRTLKIDGVVHTVVGVMPPGFALPEYAHFWVRVPDDVRKGPRTDRSLGVVGRLRRGVRLPQADAEMRTINGAIAIEHPDTNGKWTVRTRSLRRAMTEETIQPSIVLLGAVTFVLLIACANVGNLLLVRASERQKAIAIRSALGSSRGRVVRLLLIESLLLAAGGGTIGLLVALWASGVVVAAFEMDAPFWIQFGVDWQMFAWCAGITTVTSLAVGGGSSSRWSRCC